MSRSRVALSWLAVAGGGVIGTAARYGIDLAIPHQIDEFPWSTFLINAVGSFALGWLAAAVWDRVPDWVRAGLGAGVLGSFTTFSTVMISAIAIGQGGELVGGPGSLQPGDFIGGALVVFASILVGIACALTGLLVGRRGAAVAVARRGGATPEGGEDA